MYKFTSSKKSLSSSLFRIWGENEVTFFLGFQNCGKIVTFLLALQYCEKNSYSPPWYSELGKNRVTFFPHIQNWEKNIVTFLLAIQNWGKNRVTLFLPIQNCGKIVTLFPPIQNWKKIGSVSSLLYRTEVKMLLS